VTRSATPSVSTADSGAAVTNRDRQLAGSDISSVFCAAVSRVLEYTFRRASRLEHRIIAMTHTPLRQPSRPPSNYVTMNAGPEQLVAEQLVAVAGKML
jgi:hypothetical protein